MRSELLDQVQSLSVSERIELVEAIWDTIPSDASLEAAPLFEEHRLELDRRLTDLADNPHAGRPWPEVRKRQ
jgi:putative addiction module component (TIGR02574 family)